MADPPPSPTQPGPTTTPTPPQPGPPPPPQQHQTLTPPPLQNPNPNNINPNPNPNPTLPITPFPGSGAPVVQPSFRPLPQFSPLLNYQGTPTAGVGVPPPGVGVATPNSVPSVRPVMHYQVPVPGRPPNPRLRPPFAPFPNGYVPPPQGTVAPPGSACFPSLYPAMVRPLYPIHPPGAQVVLPTVSRPPMPGIVGVRPIIPPIIRPTVPSITPAEKPQTTVYVGKISLTVEDDFMLSLLQLCGLVKSWKRVQDPSGAPRGFGFCEFESAEGVLRALRLLNKLNIDGQELVLNVNQATRGYLERYVEKKSENSRNLKETQAAGADKVGGNASSDEKNQPLKSAAEDSNNDSDKDKKDNHDVASFGIVTDKDKEGDREAVEKLTSIIEERIKTKPLPPPPPPPAIADGSGNQTLELQAKSRDGDTIENDSAEDKIDDETTSDNKAASEQDGPDTSSPDRSRRNDRRSRDRERDLKREQERELERYEREAEREHVRKEREQRRRIEEAEREFEERLRDWEYREKEKERQRHLDKEREKERERKRRKEIQYDEDDEEDDRKRWRRSVSEERRRKRLQEKKEDLADRLQEEEEIAEAKRKAEEEKQLLQQRDISKLSVAHVINGGEKALVPEEASDKAAEPDYELDSGNENQKGDGILQNGVGDESTIPSVSESDTRQIGTAPTKKLGFGLVGSGKRATVPSVFNEEDDDEARKDKKMRPLVPIDYSTEELQAIQPTVYGGQPPNLAAAAEYAKRISNVTPKEKSDAERERSRRSHDRSSQWERDHNYDNVGHAKDEKREKTLERGRDRENGVDKLKMADKQKLLDAKQLIDMIPKTKDELFSYEINWSVYDKHELHDRMRPWISKKITEFLGEEETTLVDYIVSSTQEHIQASQMLEMLQSILDDEAEMFVLKMWRMLIFEIKKVETGLALRSKS